MAELKDCPECVIEVGGASVVLRHHLQKIVDHSESKKTDKLFEVLIEKLEASKPHMQKAGMKGMGYGKAYRLIAEAKAALEAAKGVPGMIMEMHEHLAGQMDKINIAQPTDEQLVGIVGTLNWR